MHDTPCVEFMELLNVTFKVKNDTGMVWVKVHYSRDLGLILVTGNAHTLGDRPSVMNLTQRLERHDEGVGEGLFRKALALLDSERDAQKEWAEKNL